MSRGTRRWSGLLPVVLLAVATTGCLIPRHRDRILERTALPGLEAYAEGRRKIVVVTVSGPIFVPEESVGWTSEEGIARVVADLRRAAADDEVVAAILRVHSPGGSVTASSLLHREVERFRESGKPLVAYFEGVAASGGYYAAAPADRIVCHPEAVTGSIGVISIFFNVEDLLAKLGVRTETFTTGDRKDAGSPFRTMTDEERAHFQSILDGMHERFVGVVASGRAGAIDASEIRGLADGRVFAAADARDKGLVDVLGDLETAVATARELAGIDDGVGVRVIRYEKSPTGLLINLSRAETPAAAPGTGFRMELSGGMLPLAPVPRFCYLWAP